MCAGTDDVCSGYRCVQRLYGVVPLPMFAVDCTARDLQRAQLADDAGPNAAQLSHGLAAFQLPLSFPFFMRCSLSLTGEHRPTKVGTHFFSLFPFSVRELFLLLSGQCPNPGPPTHPYPVCTYLTPVNNTPSNAPSAGPEYISSARDFSGQATTTELGSAPLAFPPFTSPSSPPSTPSPPSPIPSPLFLLN